MDEEKIDIESLFDLHDDLPAPKQPRKKRPFPKKTLLAVLAAVILAGGLWAYLTFVEAKDRTDFQYTVLTQSPTRLSYAISGNYGVYVSDGQNEWLLKDVPWADDRTNNVWIRIDAVSRLVKEDWNFTALTNVICEASAHSSLESHRLAVSRMYGKKGDFAGWMVYGYLPRSAELELQLHNQDQQLTQTELLLVDPLMENYTAFDTATLLDYALHLDGMIDLLAYSSTEGVYSAYRNLSYRHPALTELIERADLPQEVSRYMSSDPTSCKVYAPLLSAIYFRHLQEADDFGTYISETQAEKMTTEALVYYLIHHNGFQTYINRINNMDKVDLRESYASAKEFCPILQILEHRDDAAKELIPLCGHEPTSRFLLCQPQFQAQMTLQDAKDYLLTCYDSFTLFSVQTSVLTEVIVSLGGVYDLVTTGTLADSMENSDVLTALTQRSEAVKYLLIYLQAGNATRWQKINATALLELPEFNRQMTDADRDIFEQYKCYPDTVPDYDPPTAQIIEEMLENTNLISSPIFSSTLDNNLWYQSARENYPILQQLEARWDAVLVMREKMLGIPVAEDVSSNLFERTFISTLLTLNIYQNPMEYILS